MKLKIKAYRSKEVKGSADKSTEKEIRELSELFKMNVSPDDKRLHSLKRNAKIKKAFSEANEAAKAVEEADRNLNNNWKLRDKALTEAYKLEDSKNAEERAKAKKQYAIVKQYERLDEKLRDKRDKLSKAWKQKVLKNLD